MPGIGLIHSLMSKCCGIIQIYTALTKLLIYALTSPNLVDKFIRIFRFLTDCGEFYSLKLIDEFWLKFAKYCLERSHE
jgi:hypothetical protein